jgi:transposase
MWLFPRLEGVPAVINAEEYRLGPAVIWRKLSRVSQSEDGSTFMARILTVVMTLRARGRNILESMTATYEAVRRNARAHALLPELIEPQQDELFIAT